MAIDWGLTVGIIGTAISAAGFCFTIHQLKRTARATEAVTTTVAQLRNRMLSFDLASECIQAKKSLQHASRMLKMKQWTDSAATLLEVQSIFHRISENLYKDHEKSRIYAETAKHLLISIEMIEDSEEKKIEFNARETVSFLRKQINMLDSEIMNLNKDIYNNV